MVVGMATVFAILLIVIYLGKAMIALVNKYAPEEAVAAKKEGPAPISANIMAAISAAQCRGCRSDTRQRQGDEGGETEIKNTLFIFLQNRINDEKRN